MEKVELFSTEKLWFKGNLHTHSTISDGKQDPRQVVDLYYQRGYHFLAFTEHDIFSRWTEYDCPGFLIIPGMEASGERPASFERQHILGLAGKLAHGFLFQNKGLVGAEGAQVIIDRLRQEDCFTVYCHPVWSRQSFADLAGLTGFQALEIYNHGCHIEDCTGYALYYWDAYLRQGLQLWGIATDDSHQKIEDYGGGWVVVNAPSLTITDIIQGLKEGAYYSSNGPSIEAYGLEGGKVYIRCSPAESIHFISFERRGKSFHAESGKSLTEAVHVLHGDEKYVRVEVVDAKGKTAWSNPIFF